MPSFKASMIRGKNDEQWDQTVSLDQDFLFFPSSRGPGSGLSSKAKLKCCRYLTIRFIYRRDHDSVDSSKREMIAPRL